MRASCRPEARQVPLVAITLPEAVDELLTFHGVPNGPPTSDVFELVLFENIAYLAPDDRRRQAFERLRTEIGTRPEDLLKASRESLERVTALGALKGTSAAKLVRCAKTSAHVFNGDLSRVLEEPDEVAKRALRRFPGIGEPGAEKILLFAGGRPFLAPDSNGLRVLSRLGLIGEESSYARTYSAARAVSGSLGTDVARFQLAHAVLRVHGKRICRRKEPMCTSCPLRRRCAFARAES